MPTRLPSLAPMVLALSATLAGADTPQPGFTVTELPLPNIQSSMTLVTTLSTGEYLVFSGSALDLFDAGGLFVRRLDFFNFSFVRPLSVLVDPTETFVVYSYDDLMTGLQFGTFRVDLAGGTPLMLSGNYASFGAAFESPDSMLLVYGESPGPGPSVHRMDVLTGTQEELIDGIGVGGPLTLDRQGNVLLASYDFLNTWWDIVRFTPSQLAGPLPLCVDDGELAYSGFAEIFQVASDPLGGGVYVIEEIGSSERLLALENPLVEHVLVDIDSGESRTLQFLPGDGLAAFAGFQPATGGTLFYTTFDGVRVEGRTVEAARATLTLGGPGTTGPGSFEVLLSAAPPLGSGLVLFGPAGLYSARELVYALRVPLFLGLDLATLDALPGAIAVDANGDGVGTYANPAGLTGFAFQALLFDKAGGLVGTSSASFF